MEQLALRNFLDNNLANYFIRPSQSPSDALILFIKRKDSSLRLGVENRGLNRVKYNCPLPLIPDLLDCPRAAPVFSKIGALTGSLQHPVTDLSRTFHVVFILPHRTMRNSFKRKRDNVSTVSRLLVEWVTLANGTKCGHEMQISDNNIALRFTLSDIVRTIGLNSFPPVSIDPEYETGERPVPESRGGCMEHCRAGEMVSGRQDGREQVQAKHYKIK